MKYLFLILIGMGFLSCESTKNHTIIEEGFDVNKLEGTWELNYMDIESSFNSLYPTAKPFIKFDVAAKRVSGKTSCNSFSGPLNTKGSAIDFTGPIAMTKMFCAGQGEPAFVDRLTKVNTFAIKDAELSFLTNGKVTMRFNKKM